MTQPLLQAADLRNASDLTTEALSGLASLVQAVHGNAGTQLRSSGSPEGELQYETKRGVSRLAGNSAETLLDWLSPSLAAAEAHQIPQPEREAVLAALNGVLGDHLATTDNPLAIAMHFRHAGQPLTMDRHALRARLPQATRKLLVLVHGLCMNDLQWQRHGHDHGAALARELGYTPVYLHYNSGLSISTNGRILAQHMEWLYAVWPGAVERLVVLGHGMGGLVARSAVYHGTLLQRGSLRWPGRVDDLITLGTPHQGAPLFQAAHGLELLLGTAPYAAPLARLARQRSAGIDDFCMGNVLAGQTGGDGAEQTGRLNLPPNTRCYAVAGSLAASGASAKARAAGDGLVPVASALGQNDDPQLDLGLAPDHQAVVPQTGHLDLLSSADVQGLLVQWLR